MWVKMDGKMGNNDLRGKVTIIKMLNLGVSPLPKKSFEANDLFVKMPQATLHSNTKWWV